MESINGRYSVLREIGESENSVNYLADDERTGQRVVLKLINRNKNKTFPHELFRREYILQRQLSHPLIRKALRYEPFYQQDGRPLSSSDFIIVQRFIQYSLTDEGIPFNEPLSRQLVHALRFLQYNGTYHGDLKENNILVDAEGTLQLTDISPLFHLKEGHKEDLKALRRIFINRGLPLDPEKEYSLTDYEHGEKGSDSWEEKLLNQHLRESRFPLHLLVPEYEDLPRLYSWVHFYSPYSPDSAQLYAAQVKTLYEAEGSLLWTAPDDVEHLSPELLMKDFMESLPSWDVYSPYLKSWERISGKKTGEERIPAAVDLLTHLASVHPLVFSFPLWDVLDGETRNLVIQLFHGAPAGSVKVLTAGSEVLEEREIFHYQVENLSQEESDRVMGFYLYRKPLASQDLELIHQYTQGIPSLLLQGIRQAGERAAVTLDSPDGTPRFSPGISQLFSSHQDFVHILNKLTGAEKQVLSLFPLLGGEVAEDLLQGISPLHEAQEKLLSRGFITEVSGILRLRHPHCHPGDEIRLSPALQKKLFEALGRQLREGSLAYYSQLAAELGLLEEGWKRVETLFRTIRDEGSLKQDLWRETFFFFRRESRGLSPESRISLSWYLSRLLTDVEDALRRELLEEMEMQDLPETPLFRIFRETLLVELKEQDLLEDDYFENLLQEGLLFDDPEGAPFLGVCLDHLWTKGMVDEGCRLAEEYILPAAERVEAPDMKFFLYRKVFPFFHSRRRSQEAGELAEKLLDIVFLYPEKLSVDTLFNGYNIYATQMRVVGNIADARHYNEMAYDLALSRGYYRGLTASCNNLGVLSFYEQKPVSEISQWFERGMNNALLTADYHLYYMSLLNEVENRLKDFQFAGVMELLERAEDHIKQLPQGTLAAGLSLFKAVFSYSLGLDEMGDSLLAETGWFFDQGGVLPHEPAYRTYDLLRTLPKEKKKKRKHLQAALQEVEAKSHESALLFRVNLLYELFWRQEKELCQILLEDLTDSDRTFLKKSEPYQGALLAIYCQEESFSSPAFCKSLRWMQFYLRLTSHSPEEAGIDTWEVLFQALLTWQRLIQGLPLEMVSSFLGTPMMQAWLTLFQEWGIADPSTVSIEGLREELLPRIENLREAHLSEHWENQEFLPLMTEEELIEKTFHDITLLGGYQRGIYFEFDAREGWVKKAQSSHPLFFRENEVHQESLLEELQTSRRDGFFLWQNSAQAPDQISHAMAFPVVDITNSRVALGDKNASLSSANILYHIRGVFYFDTKGWLLPPHPQLPRQLYYLREYVNLAMHSHHLQVSTMQDEMTGLLKRETWISMVRDRFQFVRENKKVMALVMIDVDHFKDVNDTFGHQAGDKVLRRIASLLQKQVRNVDLCGRYGGEEFTVAMVLNKRREAKTAMERLCRSVAEADILQSRKITISLGGAFYPHDGYQINEVLEKADQALLSVKETGRNRSRLWREIADWQRQKKQRPLIGSASRDQDKVRLLLKVLSEIEYTPAPGENLARLNDEVSLVFEGVLFSLVRQEKTDITSWGEQPDGGFDLELPQQIGERFYRLGLMAEPGSARHWCLYGVIRPDNARFHLEEGFFSLMAQSFLEKQVLVQMA